MKTSQDAREETIEGPEALNRGSKKIATFEIASGQRMNREKTVIVPARKLTEKEEKACRSEWKTIKISYKERLLGIFIGLNATIWDQYNIPIEKFEKAIEIVDEARKNMSLACRITVANVFLILVLPYPNRHFFMPQKLLQHVTGLLLNVLTRTKICKLGIFTHVKKIYGIKIELRDVRLANVASLLSTYITNGLSYLTTKTGAKGRVTEDEMTRPTHAWAAACGFYKGATKREALDTCSAKIQSKLGLTGGGIGNPSEIRHQPITRWLYQTLQTSEQQQWESYLLNRIASKGWDTGPFMSGLRSIPRSIPQTHRWFLFRTHLNARMTTHRLASARCGEEAKCPLCGKGPDTYEHLHECVALDETKREIEKRN